MNKPDLRIFGVIIIVLIIVALVVIFFPYGKKTEDSKGTPTKFALPTDIEKNVNTVNNSNKIATPTPQDFTGVKDLPLPKTLVDQSTQKQNLRRKTPLTQPTFSVNFDYKADLFTVILNQPKDKSKIDFNYWLKQNYPLIPLDRFIFQ